MPVPAEVVEVAPTPAPRPRDFESQLSDDDYDSCGFRRTYWQLSDRHGHKSRYRKDIQALQP